MRSAIIFIVAATLGAATASAHAIEIAVPADYSTIQAALSAAADGDVIEVSPGTYFENIDFLGKAVTLISVAGPSVTVIDGASLDVTVKFVTGEGPDSIIEGFTITHGSPIGFFSDGGGILCDGASPIIRGNIVVENQSYWTGAGIALVTSAAQVLGNTITNNQFFCVILDAPCGQGAGIYSTGGSPLIAGNTIFNNVAPQAGGGVFVGAGGVASIFSNQIFANTGGDGGGVFIAFDANAVLTNNFIADNIASGYFTLCCFVPGRGAGVYAGSNSSLELSYCTIVDNTCNSSPTFDVSQGGGLELDGGTATIVNSIVWGNFADDAAQIYSSAPAVQGVTFCDVEGGFSGAGNIAADPQFVAGSLGNHYLSQLAAGQLVESPCVNAGDPTLVLGAGTTRTDHAPDIGNGDLGFHYLLPVVGLGDLSRGDANSDGIRNIADAIFLLQSLFVPSAPSTSCADSADVNDDGGFDVADPIVLLTSLFVPGSPLIPPPLFCGVDSTLDALDCASSASCP